MKSLNGMARQTLPVLWPTVIHSLKDAAERAPDHSALICLGERLSYLDYAACVSGFAHQLKAMGIGTGSRVAILLPNCLDLVIAMLGAQAAGMQVVGLNPEYTASELGPILDNAAPSLILAGPDERVRLAEALDRNGPPVIVVGPGAWRLTLWAGNSALARDLPLPGPDDLATVQYTGGTTGRSKGAELTHHALSVNTSQREAVVPMRPEAERLLAITPLFHVYAVSMGIHMALFSRSTLVILPRYRPDVTLAAISEHRITVMLGSPTIYTGLLGYDELAAADLTSLEVSVSGSAALPGEILLQWEKRTGSKVLEGYGQTESGPVLSFNPRYGRCKVGSVGLVVPETRVEIVDLTTGASMPSAGSVGEIRARGPQIMQGYRDMPLETAEALRDGWLYTGDIGEFDADGFLYIRGRRKEMVIVGGYNVYPREIEEVLFTHPGVAETAVIGVPDAYRGEALVALVVPAQPDLTAEALFAHIASRLVKYKWPSRILLRLNLPKTSVGKIDKVKLEAELLAGP